MRLPLIGWFGLGLLATTAACQSSSDATAGSESAHKDGALVWSNDPHGWADLDRAAFDASRPNEKTAPASHLASSRLQTWVDRYEKVARDIVRATGTELAAPHPYARIVVAPGLEPAITTVPVCIANATTPPTKLPADESPLAILEGPKSFVNGAAGETCLTARSWSSASGLAWFNKLAGYKVVPGTSAVAVNDGTTAKGKATRVAVRAAPSFIDVNAGTIATLSEKGVAVAIAHQMAHYLRTHSTTGVAGKYDYWYDRTAPAAERPAPVAEQAKYADQYEKLKLPRFLVPGQVHNARIAATLIGWLENASLAATHVCAPAQTALKSLAPSIHDELVGGDAPLSQDARQAYLDLEGKLQPCVDGAELSDVEEPTDGTTVVFDDKTLSRPWLAARIEAPVAAEITPEDLAATQTLKDLVVLLDAAGKKLDEQAPEFLQHLADNAIGRYTAEQEADELSMELATRIGLTMDEVTAGYVELMYAQEKEDPKVFLARQGMTAKACEDLAKAGFKNADREVYVSMGALEDAHHAFCYRLLNLQREREVHSYPVVTPAFKEPTTPWSNVQASAIELLHPGSVKSAQTSPGPTPAPSDPPAADTTAQDPAPAAPAQDTTTSDEPADDTASEGAPTIGGKKASSGGCSTAPGTSASYEWLLGLAAVLVLARRRVTAG